MSESSKHLDTCVQVLVVVHATCVLINDLCAIVNPNSATAAKHLLPHPDLWPSRRADEKEVYHG